MAGRRSNRAGGSGGVYNDYGGEGMNAKSDRIYEPLRDLLGKGVPVDGVGLQMHISANSRPSHANIAANIRRLASLGLVVHISEMDVRIKKVAGSDQTRLEVQRTRIVTSCGCA